MADDRCPEYARLEAEAHAIMEKVIKLGQAQLKSMERGDSDRFTELDRELENTVGHKERTIGALRQHADDHGCQRKFMPDL